MQNIPDLVKTPVQSALDAVEERWAFTEALRLSAVSEEKILDVALAVFQTSVSAWRDHIDAPYVASRDVAFWTGQFQNTYESIRKQIKLPSPVDKKSET